MFVIPESGMFWLVHNRLPALIVSNVDKKENRYTLPTV